MGQGHGGSAKFRRVGDREIDFMLGRNTALEGHPVGLRDGVAVTMCDEIQTLLLLQCGLEVAGLADQAGLSLLADAALEQRFDKDQLVASNETLDVVFARGGSQHLGTWEIDVAEKLRSVQHSGKVHVYLLKLCGVDTTKGHRAIIDALVPDGNSV